jgi:hypothetical protein
MCDVSRLWKIPLARALQLLKPIDYKTRAATTATTEATAVRPQFVLLADAAGDPVGDPVGLNSQHIRAARGD